MTRDTASADLIRRLRGGDESAAQAVFEKFAHRLVALARRRLSTLVRPKLDPEDVVQSVFKSFFGRLAGGQLDLGEADGLWGLLAVITVRKCAKKSAHYHTAGRDVRKEVGGPDDGAPAGWEALAREPTPDEAAILVETVEQLMQGLPEHERPMLVLRLQGYTTREVSAQLGCTERKVQRVLERGRRRLERLQSQGPDGP